MFAHVALLLPHCLALRLLVRQMGDLLGHVRTAQGSNPSAVAKRALAATTLAQLQPFLAIEWQQSLFGAPVLSSIEKQSPWDRQLFTVDPTPSLIGK